MLASEGGQRAARRGHLDHAVGGEQTERRTVGLGDVGRRLEKAVEHAPRIELQRDLLAEPPHAVQHALRVVELEGALGDTFLERHLHRLLLGHPMLKPLGGMPLGDEREAPVEGEQCVERGHRDGQLEAR